jgi:hypothetical protein
MIQYPPIWLCYRCEGELICEATSIAFSLGLGEVDCCREEGKSVTVLIQLVSEKRKHRSDSV